MKATFEPVSVPRERLVSIELTPEEALAVCNLLGKTSVNERVEIGISKKDSIILSDLFYSRITDNGGLDDVLKRGGLR